MALSKNPGRRFGRKAPDVLPRRAVANWFICACLISVSFGALAQSAGPATRTAERSEASRLILLLGDNDYSKREEASKRLADLGDEALPALQAAMADPDMEVGQRARVVYWLIVELPPERHAAIAANAARAYAEADYVGAARQQMLLARRHRPTIAECMAVGNDWQLANRWAEAVAGYQRALERLDQVIAGDPEEDAPPMPAGGFGGGGGVPAMRGGGGGRGPMDGKGMQGAPGLTDYQKRELMTQRSGLVLLIGRLQRDMLGDVKAAAVTFARVLEWTPEFKGDLPTLLKSLAADVQLRRARKEVPHDVGRGLTMLNEFDAMEELGRCEEKLGRNDDAILTLARLSNAFLHTRDDGVENSLAEMSRLIPQSEAAGKNADAMALVKLTPPTVTARPIRKAALDLAAGSPFKATETNLASFKLGAMAIGDLAKMADGRWIAAMNIGPRIYTATTRDLVMWDAPVLLPHNGIANNTDPTMTVDAKGEIWLTWFSNRLSLQPRSSGGYQLWLTHSADGKSWSSPRAISADTGGWPMGAMQWLKDGNGAFRLSWRSASATATSPEEISKVEAIDIHRPERMWPMDPCVAQDFEGRYHMVFNDVLQGITYSRSDDGKKWSDPVLLVETKPNSAGLSSPQLLIDGEQVAVVYQAWNESVLCRGKIGDISNLGAPVRIGGTGMGRRLVRDAHDVIGFSTGEAVWVLRAKMADVVGTP